MTGQLHLRIDSDDPAHLRAVIEYLCDRYEAVARAHEHLAHLAGLRIGELELQRDEARAEVDRLRQMGAM